MKLFVATKALVLRDGKMLILREADTYVEGTEVGKWDVPGGRIEVGEPLLEALQREVGEECDLAFTSPRVIDAHETFPTIRGESCHIVRIYFVVNAVPGDVVLSADHDAFLWIDPRDHEQHGLMEDLHKVCETYLQSVAVTKA